MHCLSLTPIGPAAACAVNQRPAPCVRAECLARQAWRPAWLARHAALVMLLAAVLALPTALHAQVPREPVAAQRYDIPAQPLESALTALGTASRIDILYENGVVDKMRSTALSGTFTPRDAFATILQGTGLAFRFTSLNAVLVFPPDRPPEPGVDAWRAAESAPRLVLDVLRVTGSPVIPARPSHSGFGQFGLTLQFAIKQRLQSDPRTSKKPFRVRLSIQIDEQGVLRHPSVVGSTGQPRLDTDIRAALDGMRLPTAPPDDLPQPIWFNVAVR